MAGVPIEIQVDRGRAVVAVVLERAYVAILNFEPTLLGHRVAVDEPKDAVRSNGPGVHVAIRFGGAPQLQIAGADGDALPVRVVVRGTRRRGRGNGGGRRGTRAGPRGPPGRRGCWGRRGCRGRRRGWRGRGRPHR